MTPSYLGKDEPPRTRAMGIIQSSPHCLCVFADLALQFLLQESDPHSQGPSLLNSPAQGIFEIQKVAIEASLICELGKESSVVRRHWERRVCVGFGRACSRCWEGPNEQSQAVGFRLGVFKYSGALNQCVQ